MGSGFELDRPGIIPVQGPLGRSDGIQADIDRIETFEARLRKRPAPERHPDLEGDAQPFELGEFGGNVRCIEGGVAIRQNGAVALPFIGLTISEEPGAGIPGPSL